MTTPGTPSRKLPVRPNLRHLKDEAKARLKAAEFAKLSDAQFAIAREFGFASWPKLSHQVEAITRRNLADSEFESDDLVAFLAAVRDDKPAQAARILSRVFMTASVSANGIVALSVSPWARQRMTSFASSRSPFEPRGRVTNCPRPRNNSAKKDP